MDSTFTNWVVSNIDQVIELVKQASPKLWEIAYRQAYIEPQLYTIWFSAMLLVFGIIMAVAIIIGQKNNRGEGYWIPLCIVGAIGTVIGFVGTIVEGWCLVAVHMNPDYYAFQKLLEMLGK